LRESLELSLIHWTTEKNKTACIAALFLVNNDLLVVATAFEFLNVLWHSLVRSVPIPIIITPDIVMLMMMDSMHVMNHSSRSTRTLMGPTSILLVERE